MHIILRCQNSKTLFNIYICNSLPFSMILLNHWCISTNYCELINLEHSMIKINLGTK